MQIHLGKSAEYGFRPPSRNHSRVIFDPTVLLPAYTGWGLVLFIMSDDIIRTTKKRTNTTMVYKVTVQKCDITVNAQVIIGNGITMAPPHD
jgi:hypothetical protein